MHARSYSRFIQIPKCATSITEGQRQHSENVLSTMQSCRLWSFWSFSSNSSTCNGRVRRKTTSSGNSVLNDDDPVLRKTESNLLFSRIWLLSTSLKHCLMFSNWVTTYSWNAASKTEYIVTLWFWHQHHNLILLWEIWLKSSWNRHHETTVYRYD